MKPHLIFSAHSHHSSYIQVEDAKLKRSSKNGFLLAANHPSFQYSYANKLPFFKGQGHDHSYGIDELDKETILLETSASITIQLNAIGEGKNVHEIAVPTCSYRMGVPHSGFGAFHLCKFRLP